jgi:hypothetical protein
MEGKTMKGQAKSVLPKLLEVRRTKQEISRAFGVSERVARRMIQEVAKEYPVLAHSQAVGYKLFESDADVEDAIITLLELRSRSKELKEREKPIVRELRKRGIRI